MFLFSFDRGEAGQDMSTFSIQVRSSFRRGPGRCWVEFRTVILSCRCRFGLDTYNRRAFATKLFVDFSNLEEFVLVCDIFCVQMCVYFVLICT